MKVVSVIRGCFSLLLYLVNCLVFCPIGFVIGLLKLLPIPAFRSWLSKVIDRIANIWISINNLNQRLTASTKYQVELPEGLSPQQWYMVISNHQSWVDILVLQRVLHGKIPFLKFFLKQQLIWVPLLGLCWWALDFPFMKRYSRSFLEKNPHLKGKDIETTRKACARFKHKPVCVMNFLEGTRFTEQKHEQQNSDYDNLLIPKAGGLAFTLSAMEELKQLVDVTIYYPDGTPSFWQFACGGVKEVVVKVRLLPIELDRQGDYFNDPDYRAEFQQWVNQLWETKDRVLNDLKQRYLPKPQLS